MKKEGWMMGVLATVALVPALAAAKLGGANSSDVSFIAKGPAGFKITGDTSDLKVHDDGTNVVVTVGLNAISTGIGLRDRHTRIALEADKYPSAELTVSRSALKFPEGGGSEGDVTGTMNLHGVSRPVAFHYTVKREGGELLVAATASLNFNDFGVKAPNYAGITVKPDVAIRTSFRTKDE